MANSPCWELEPEFRSPILPRRLQSRSLYQTHLWIFSPATILLIAFLMGHGLGDLQRWHILRNGVPGTASIQRVYQLAVGKYGRGRQTHFVLAYSPEPGRFAAADVRIRGSLAAREGQVFPVHLIPDRAGWVALDGDKGQSSADQLLAWITIPFTALLAGLMAYAEHKRRYLLCWGKAVGATITRMDRPYRGKQTVEISYESEDGPRSASDIIDTDFHFKVGQVVTALVHERYPKTAVIYASAPYRVV